MANIFYNAGIKCMYGIKDNHTIGRSTLKTEEVASAHKWFEVFGQILMYIFSGQT